MSENVCTFFKKRANSNIRQKKKKNDSSSSSSGEEEIVVLPKIRKQINPLLFQKTCNFSSNSNNHAAGSDEDDNNLGVISYKASKLKESLISKDKLATATCEVDTDVNCDAQAIFERSQKLNKESCMKKDDSYKGLNNYHQYVEKKDTVLANASSGFNRKGPMRAPGNLRATVRWDYQPDICKDYKETGYCTFGDSCKFLHDRSDYKHGWQIDQELEEGVFGIDGEDNRYEILQHSSDEMEDDLPYVCMICRKDFKDPVVTIECALARYKKSARCYACTADTKGHFKFANNLLERINQMKESRKKCHDHDHSHDDDDDEDHDDKSTDAITRSSAAEDIVNDDTGAPVEKEDHDAAAADDDDDDGDCSNDACQDQANLSLKPNSVAKVFNPKPKSNEPNWAKPELVEYCDSDEEQSD